MYMETLVIFQPAFYFWMFMRCTSVSGPIQRCLSKSGLNSLPGKTAFQFWILPRQHKLVIFLLWYSNIYYTADGFDYQETQPTTNFQRLRLVFPCQFTDAESVNGQQHRAHSGPPNTPLPVCLYCFFCCFFCFNAHNITPRKSRPPVVPAPQFR